MPANQKQIKMRQALVAGYLDTDSPTQGNFAESVLAAGYSRTSLTVRRTRYRAWIEQERRARSIAAPNEASLPGVARHWSPISGRTLPEWTSGPFQGPRETPPPPAMTLEVRKQREFEAVVERTAARQAAERNTAFAMSYVPKFRRYGD